MLFLLTGNPPFSRFSWNKKKFFFAEKTDKTLYLSYHLINNPITNFSRIYGHFQWKVAACRHEPSDPRRELRRIGPGKKFNFKILKFLFKKYICKKNFGKIISRIKKKIFFTKILIFFETLIVSLKHTSNHKPVEIDIWCLACDHQERIQTFGREGTALDHDNCRQEGCNWKKKLKNYGKF